MPKPYLFASLFTGVFDVNRNEILRDNDFQIIQKWYNSVVHLELNAIVFHNTFSQEVVERFSNEMVRFIYVPLEKDFNPNIFRYIAYSNFLSSTRLEISHLFLTDITDVEVVRNPFQSELFLSNKEHLFCGDEPKTFDNEWMKAHCAHLREQLSEFALFENEHEKSPLLNCGIFGGRLAEIQKLLQAISELHQRVSVTNTTPFTLDMGVFNYLARTMFREKIIHGEPVNTVFKGYEEDRLDCWFRHK